MGTVSSVLGKEYGKPRPLTHRSVEYTKALKLDCKDFPLSEVWSEKNPPSMLARHGTMQADVEEFLFKMLGDGFQLDMTLIQEVLGRCGYDTQKAKLQTVVFSIIELLDLSASTLEKSDDVVSMAVEESIKQCSDQESFSLHSTKQCSEQESFSLQEQMQQLCGTQSGDGARLNEENLTDSLKREHNRVSLEREILQSLFDLPERSEEAPKKTRLARQARRSSAFGEPVVTPLKDTAKEHKPSAAKPLADTRGGAHYIFYAVHSFQRVVNATDYFRRI